jgi:hypothetical protein
MHSFATFAALPEMKLGYLLAVQYLLQTLYIPFHAEVYLFRVRSITMGVRPEPTVYNLTFSEETSLGQAGVKVKISCGSIREMNQMLRTKNGATGEETADANDSVALLFLDHLIEWNLDAKDGSPLPHTLEGISELEPGTISQMVTAWQVAMMSVPTILKKPSPNGSMSEEESLGLGNASENLSSWPKPNSS